MHTVVPLYVLLLLLLCLSSLAGAQNNSTTTNTTITVPCIYTQAYWLRQHSQATTTTNETSWSPLDSQLMCGKAWRRFLFIDVQQMARPANIYWMAAFHLYATVALNNNTVPPPASVLAALLITRDTLERACDSISGWPLNDTQSVAYSALQVLRQFVAANPCADEFPIDPSSADSAFYYTNTPDLIVIPPGYGGRGDNTTALIYSLLSDTYRFRDVTLSASIIACLVVIPLLICVIACIANRRRLFYAKQRRERGVKQPRLQQQQQQQPLAPQTRERSNMTVTSADDVSIELCDLSERKSSHDGSNPYNYKT